MSMQYGLASRMACAVGRLRGLPSYAILRGAPRPGRLPERMSQRCEFPRPRDWLEKAHLWTGAACGASARRRVQQQTAG